MKKKCFHLQNFRIPRHILYNTTVWIHYVWIFCTIWFNIIIYRKFVKSVASGKYLGNKVKKHTRKKRYSWTQPLRLKTSIGTIFRILCPVIFSNIEFKWNYFSKYVCYPVI